MVTRIKRVESFPFLTLQSSINPYCGNYTQRGSSAPAYAQTPKVGNGLSLFTSCLEGVFPETELPVGSSRKLSFRYIGFSEIVE